MSNLSHAPLASLADAEGIIEFASYADMAARLDFCESINPKETKPARILGVYQLREKVKCCLPDQTAHNMGYYVCFDDGREGPMGHVCGKREFGDEFEVLRKKFESQRRVKDYRERLGDFRSKVSAHLEEIYRLSHEECGAGWLQKSMEAFRRDCPSALLSELRRRAPTKDGRVFEVLVLRGEEAERRLAAEGRSSRSDDERSVGNDAKEKQEAVYRTEKLVGMIKGLGIWAQRASVRELLIDKLQHRLLEFEKLNVFSLREGQLRVWVRFAEGVPQMLEEARAFVEEGRAFFTDENMKLFQHLGISPQSLHEFRRQRWDNTSGKWRLPPQR